MSSDAPLVTVAIATKDGEQRIGSAIARVIGQRDVELEVVVVEGGSSDRTAEVAAAVDDHRVRVICLDPDVVGLSRARNAGIAAARGRWIVFLDDDDVPHDDWLATIGDALEDRPALVVCGWREVDPAGAVLAERIPAPAETGVQLAGTFAVRRDVLDAVGGFADELPISHQTELLWRVVPFIEAHGERVATIARPLIDITRRPPGQRWSTDPHRVLAGTDYLLRTHAERLAAAPASHADLLNVAGVAAARTGDYRLARRRFRTAVARHPRNVRSWARWALASVPPLGRRQWPIV